MAKYLFGAALILILIGCVARVTPLSPRLLPSDAHRGAQSNTSCVECHGDPLPKSHQATDDCRNCHKLQPGGAA